jgi:hypothetical protein
MVFLASIACGMFGPKPPAGFIRTFGESGTWRTVDIREGMEEDKDELWATVVDVVSQKFDLEVLDKDSGYLRTTWKYTLRDGDRVSERYRARINVKFSGSGWERLQVKSEANWMEEDSWVPGEDNLLLEDIYSDIQGRVGRVVR